MAQWGIDLKNKAVSAASNMVSGIIYTITSLPSKMLNIGKNLVQGIWNGISNTTDWILSKIKGFGSSILKGIKSIFGIHSPSTLMRDEVAKFLAEGILSTFSITA